ncbi:MAG: hypothetical protein ABSG77_04250 [Candidatus Acidiferrum sp.]|jgi:hypothetical protein
MTAPQSLPDSTIHPHRVLKFAALLAAFSLWAVPAYSSSSTPNRDVSEVRAILAQSLLEMNHDGRLPLSGIAGHGPNGRIVQIDPWEGNAETARGKS